MKIKIGTRKSNLALKQVEELIKIIRQFEPALECEIIGVATTGDIDKKTSISKIEGSDFFTKEIEEKLLKGAIDMAVHSAKDLPYPLRQGLRIAAITKGIDHRDVFVSKDHVQLKQLPPGANIGTSSKRRKEQLKHVRPDINIIDIRGTIEERLDFVEQRAVDGVIIAAAGLLRLSLENRISEYLDFKTPYLQGKLAVEIQEQNTTLGNLLKKIDHREHLGTVSLIGAGSGDPGLLTVKGKRKLEEADIILYDDLVNETVFSSISALEKICVGKRKGNHHCFQEEILQRLVRYSDEGKNVARLKGGDPFIFGRGGEEVEFLKRNYIPFEIIPGITAAQAASSYAEIPLTQRGIASSVAFCTGHPVENIPVPEADTLVYYMAASSLPEVVTKVLEKGWPQDTPAAVITNASLPSQKVTITTLKKLSLNSREYSSPAIVIFGNVVNQTNENNWYNSKKKVLVTGTNPQRYRFLGEVIHHPLIELVPLEDYDALDREIEHLQDFTITLFTSKHAVRFFFDRLYAIKKDARHLFGQTICSIGKETTKALRKFSIVPDMQPFFESSQGLIDEFRKRVITDARILIPRSNLAHHELPDSLSDLGNTVTTVIAYLNRIPGNVTKMDLSCIDSIVFTSPSGVRNFQKIYGCVPKHIEIITIGEVTDRAVGNMQKNV